MAKPARKSSAGARHAESRPKSVAKKSPSRADRPSKAPTQTDAGTVYQLKVTLKHVKPAVWRRLQVPCEITMAKLHSVLQDALGWTNSHLHQFVIGERRIGMKGIDA